MQQQTLVTEQFGNNANAYLSSAVHATGEDLLFLQKVAERHNKPRILDLGCGAGHASFAVAAKANSVVAYDISEQMLAVVAEAAVDRQLNNVETRYGAAENLPFANEEFDMVITRFSAHHWQNLPDAINEVNRVLKKKGTAVFIDVVSPEAPLFDTTLQAVEILRDASHVRNYRLSEWQAIFTNAAMNIGPTRTWKLPMRFDQWIARMQTPKERVLGIRSLFNTASTEVKEYFSLQPDLSFSIDVALFELSKHG